MRPSVPLSLPCACATSRRASRAITGVYGKGLRDTGLEITQFTLLQTLYRAGELTQRRLGEILLLDSTTLSRTLSPLDRSGWIKARPGKDRREKIIAITPAGQTRMTAALEPWKQVQIRLKKVLGETGWTEAMQAMERLTAAALVMDHTDEQGAKP